MTVFTIGRGIRGLVSFPQFLKDPSGLDKDLDQWVFHPLLFLFNEYFTPYLKYLVAENAKPC